MTGLVDDATYLATLRHFAPAIDPDSRRGLEIRRRLEGCAGVLRALYRRKGAGHDELKTFEAYAAAGEHFARGLSAMNEWISYHDDFLERVTGKRREHKQLIQREFIEKVQQITRMMQDLASYTEQFNSDDELAYSGPNSKPWLHEAVMALWQLWEDEGQSSRTKSDFISYCFAFIEPAGVYITRDSITESVDRHLKPNIEAMRGLRIAPTKRHLEK